MKRLLVVIEDAFLVQFVFVQRHGTTPDDSCLDEHG